MMHHRVCCRQAVCMCVHMSVYVCVLSSLARRQTAQEWLPECHHLWMHYVCLHWAVCVSVCVSVYVCVCVCGCFGRERGDGGLGGGCTQSDSRLDHCSIVCYFWQQQANSVPNTYYTAKTGNFSNMTTFQIQNNILKISFLLQNEQSIVPKSKLYNIFKKSILKQHKSPPLILIKSNRYFKLSFHHQGS